MESNYTFDVLLVLKAAGLIAADAASATVVDMGSGHYRGDVVIDVSAVEVASGDEHYEIVMQGSNSPTFASGVVNFCSLRVGDGTTIATELGAGSGNDIDDGAGSRYILPFRNERAGTIYRYGRLYTRVTGTIATGINYTAVIGKPKA